MRVGFNPERTAQLRGLVCGHLKVIDFFDDWKPGLGYLVCVEELQARPNYGVKDRVRHVMWQADLPGVTCNDWPLAATTKEIKSDGTVLQWQYTVAGWSAKKIELP
jgi:hypothetical protein